MKQVWNKVIENLIYGKFWLYGKLPYRVQLIGGDILYFVLYRIMHYRVSVTRTNLASAFPEKSPEERKQIERRFYHHLADIFVETISIAGVSEKQFRARLRYPNSEWFENDTAGKTSILAMAHYGTWEYPTNYQLYSSHIVMPVYKPLRSKVMDRVYYRLRSRFGMKPVPRGEVAKTIIAQLRADEPTLFPLIGDQTPSVSLAKHWVTFLNQDTPFVNGMEKLALKYSLPVHFLYVKQTRRGYYEALFEPLYDGTEKIDDMEIIRRYAKRLEEMIRETPHLWMWSHKRWKHKRNETEASIS